VDKLDDDAAREVIRVRVPGNPDDLLLLEDLLGIRDADVALPDITPDARRRRLTALVNATALAREAPALYIIEDAHWIDDVSESMLAEFMVVTPRTPSLVLITYRPVYHGALARASGSHTITLAPLDDSHVVALTAEMLGPHASVAGLATRVAERAAGNPFFAQEIVRDLAERSVIVGDRGRYVRRGDSDDVNVPATLKAAIASRIDRLDSTSKSTLNAAAVIGSRFSADLLSRMHQNIAVAELVDAELIDQVMFAPHAEYEFHHPLIRTVAYESQLKSDRADLHRRLAGEIQSREPDSHDENAALIATHLEAAGDLHEAFDWHMRAGSWSEYRDIGAARFSWERARQVADRLPIDDADRMSMRIAPRALLCGSLFRVGGSVTDTGFDELRELCVAASDRVSLATGMAGHLTVMTFHSRYHELLTLTAQFVDLLESIGDPVLTVGLLFAAIWPKLEPCDVADGLRLTQRLIDLADGDPAKGNLLLGSPLATAILVRGVFGSWRGLPRWTNDIDEAVAMARAFDTATRVMTVMLQCLSIAEGTLLADETAMRNSAEVLELAEESGDEFALAAARLARGITLVHRDGPTREVGFELLGLARETALDQRFIASVAQIVDIQIGLHKARTGDLDGAIDLLRAVVRTLFDRTIASWYGSAVIGLVASLVRRASVGDQQEAEAVIDKFADAANESELCLNEAWLLHGGALLAQVRGDNADYREYVERYRAKAEACGYAGHLAMAEEMARAL
jgi:adenylate cyclase